MDINANLTHINDGMTAPTNTLATDAQTGKRPTQKTIARLTGLAVATVSRALADAPDIGAETKRKVRQVAHEIGYRPDRAGVRLRTGKTNVISRVLSTEDEIMNHTAQLISSIAGGLRNTPYHMIITPYFQGEDPMVPVRYLVETRSADAVILNQTLPEDPRVAFLMEHGVPFATHGRTDWCGQHPYFDFDNTAFGRLAVVAIAERGRRAILQVLPPIDQFYAQEMRNGAAEASARLGLDLTVLEGATSDDSSATISAAVQAHLQAAPDTDAMVCASPGAAMAAVQAIEAMGRILGDDIDVVSKEAVPILKQFRHPILAVQEDVARAGRFLAEAVVQTLAHPEQAPMQELEMPSPPQ